LGYIGIL